MVPGSTYVKALPLQELDDVEFVKAEVKAGNILILRVVPLARKSVEETKLAITELTDYVKSLGGDIARLGEERIVITPPGIRIWRRETAGSSTEAPIVVEAAAPQKESSRSGGPG
ncbi:MAG TPA: cell division protein SepF [Candidatus Binatus sp.]|nr:cell division protein SepF [Candidatus Binatus sp.]